MKTNEKPAVQHPTITHLPESSHCFEVMQNNGMIVGTLDGSGLIPHEWFEQTMGLRRDTLRYNTEIIRLRQLLVREGLYLAQRGNHGQGFHLLPIPATESQNKLWDRRILNLRSNQVLLSRAVLAKHSQLLTPEQKLRLSKQEETAALLLAFESNKAVAKHRKSVV